MQMILRQAEGQVVEAPVSRQQAISVHRPWIRSVMRVIAHASDLNDLHDFLFAIVHTHLQVNPTTCQMSQSTPQWLQTPLAPAMRSATKAAWFYPLRGIIHFITHRNLHPLLTSKLLVITLLSLAVTFTLFFWTLLPQALFLSIFHRPIQVAFINATFLVLSESAASTS